METHLKLVLTQCRRNKPLVSLINLHLLDTDMTPEQLRKLAGALNDAATLCEARVLNEKRLTQMACSFSLVN